MPFFAGVSFLPCEVFGDLKFDSSALLELYETAFYFEASAMMVEEASPAYLIRLSYIGSGACQHG